MKKSMIAACISGMILVSGCAPQGTASPKEKHGFYPSSSAVSQKLSQTKGLQDTYIVVKQENHRTILKGKVHTKKQKFLAGSVARSVKGSGIVENRLAVQ
ncbi:MAG: BON domain-containing protein [Campylobacterales bacterium]|nr:BON domain-containing protein [Campylobacterales bacterium]